MPLTKSSSKEALHKNIAREVGAGKDPKQAAAIAYSVQRKARSTGDKATVITLLEKLLSALKSLQSIRSVSTGDAHIEDPKEWITVNGASIPVGKGGELGGKAGAAIQSSEKGKSGGSASEIKSKVSSLRSEAKSAELSPDSRREVTSFINRAEGHRKVVEAYESGDKQKALELAHKVGALEEDYKGAGMAFHKEDAENLLKKAGEALAHGKEVYAKYYKQK